MFAVNFRLLRDLEESKVQEILNWYRDLKICDAYRNLMRLYNENRPDYWIRVQKNFSSLPEYEKLQYKLQIFVAHAKQSMPNEINPKLVKELTCDLSNSNQEIS